MAYDNFAAQLEALRNGVPSAEVFANGMAGGAFTPAAGTNMGQNLDSMYANWGIDQNANPFQGQIEKAFGEPYSPESFYTQKYGSHLATDAAGNTSQLAYRPPGLGGGSGSGGGALPSPGDGGAGGGSSLQGYSQNPYLAQMGQGLRDQFAQFRDDGLAANRGGAVAAGGVGGSRQGIAEARTMTDAGRGFDSALANLYGNDYQQQMGRNLQKYGIDQNTALGWGGLDNQRYGIDTNFYSQQRAQDQSGLALGASLYNQGTQGQWGPVQNAGSAFAPYTGNGTTVNTSSSGGGVMGGVGGALAGFGFAGQNGWWK